MASDRMIARRTDGATDEPMGRALDMAMGTGMAWFDLVLRMQRASLQSLSSYSPTNDTRVSGSLPRRASDVVVVPVGEERLNVATRTLQGETTRIRRRVVAQPVEQDVTLREEKVVVERRQPHQAAPSAAGQEVLTETVIEMSDSREIPAVWKSVHVAEEVVLRRQVTERREKVRETVRRDVVEVEHDHAAAGPDHAAELARQRTEALAEAARQVLVPHSEVKADAAGEARRPTEAAGQAERGGAVPAEASRPGNPQAPARKG